MTSDALPESWAQLALHPPRAFAEPVGKGRLRSEPDDFVVEEDLGFDPSGAGPHVLLKVRKRDVNTQWVARELARACGCHPLDVGYAGLKDRRSVAVQWFTVPRSARSIDTWSSLRTDAFEVLEAHAHSRKLPRGALAGNRFTIRVRGVAVDEGTLAERLRLIGSHGVPNYFGPQRFGVDGANLSRISAGARGLRQPERAFVLSAARSLIFNAVLAERVQAGSWNRLSAGDVANLDGRGSIFAVERIDAVLTERCARLEIHPTGPLWGGGVPPTQGAVLDVERRVAESLPGVAELVGEAGMDQERRSLRVAVRELEWAREAGEGCADEPDNRRGSGSAAVVVRFRLRRGSFATAVLREIFDFGVDEAGEE